MNDARELPVPNYVVAEALSLIPRRLGVDAARDAHRLMSLGTPLWVNPFEHATAARRFLGSGRSLSFVDCTTFAAMEARGIETAFAFDAGFERAGFTLLTA